MGDGLVSEEEERVFVKGEVARELKLINYNPARVF